MIGWYSSFSPKVAFSPDQIANLALWMDASQPQGKGGAIPANNAGFNWLDIVAGGNYVNGIYKTNAFGSKPGIQLQDKFFAYPTTLSPNHTLFMVYRVLSGGSNAIVLYAEPQTIRFEQFSGGFMNLRYQNAAGTFTQTSISVPYDFTTNHFALGRVTGTNAIFRVDSQSVAFNVPALDLNPTLRCGAWFCAIMFAEIIFYNRALDQNEMNNVEKYLKAKYSLPA